MHSSHLSLSAALCPDPVDINNGVMTFTGNSVNDTATYTCNSGFELIGDATRICTQVDANFAIFSPQAPLCRRKEESQHVFIRMRVLQKNSQWIHY